MQAPTAVLGAKKHFYKRVCLSVRPSVRNTFSCRGVSEHLMPCMQLCCCWCYFFIFWVFFFCFVFLIFEYLFLYCFVSFCFVLFFLHLPAPDSRRSSSLSASLRRKQQLLTFPSWSFFSSRPTNDSAKPGERVRRSFTLGLSKCTPTLLYKIKTVCLFVRIV